MADVLKAVMKPLNRMSAFNAFQRSAGFNRTQLAVNPAFSGTGGTKGTGVTGTVPDNWQVLRVSGDTQTTAVAAIEAATDGGGNWLRIDYTAFASGNGIRIKPTADLGNTDTQWLQGDLLRLLTTFEVQSGAQNLAYVTNTIQIFDGTTTITTYSGIGDLTGAGNLPGDDGTNVYEHASEMITVPDHSAAGSFLLIQPLEMKFSGAGTGTVRVRMPRCEVVSQLV
jgi:hypothetical protein